LRRNPRGPRAGDRWARCTCIGWSRSGLASPVVTFGLLKLKNKNRPVPSGAGLFLFVVWGWDTDEHGSDRITTDQKSLVADDVPGSFRSVVICTIRFDPWPILCALRGC